MVENLITTFSAKKIISIKFLQPVLWIKLNNSRNIINFLNFIRLIRITKRFSNKHYMICHVCSHMSSKRLFGRPPYCDVLSIYLKINNEIKLNFIKKISFHKVQFNNEKQLVWVLTTNLQVISSNPAGAFIIFTDPTDFNKIFWLNIVKLENSKRITT